MRGSAYSVAGDPHWIRTRHSGHCTACMGTIPAGARAFYWPKGKYLECARCGESSAARFEGECMDEILSGGWSG